MGVDYEIRPTRYDPRFPNQNQTVHCWQYYVDYFKCAKELANEDPSKQRICDQFQNAYRMLCPASWVNKWDEQRESGIFPADINE
ncbi:cytochrome c oxidase, subunit VIb [Myxozyma melibiosi]|uniref:Cytochrome c oxidase, subunit VIb n=1 Tax=Myxozyma melibiosi TaxID=54550 RepID=A0ABR1F9F6_9ASCO